MDERLNFMYFRRVILHITGNTGQWTKLDNPCLCQRERARAVLWAGVSLLSSVIQYLMYSLWKGPHEFFIQDAVVHAGGWCQCECWCGSAKRTLYVNHCDWSAHWIITMNISENCRLGTLSICFLTLDLSINMLLIAYSTVINIAYNWLHARS